MKDYIFNVHDMVLLMTAAECLLLSLFQLALPLRERSYGLLLAAFLLIVATASACTLILWNDQFDKTSLFGQWLLPYLLFATLMLKGPAIYLFVSALTQQKLRLRWRHGLHGLPALALLLFIFIFGLSSDDLRHLNAAAQGPRSLLVDWVWDLAKVVPLVYAVAAVLALHRYRRELEDEYSHISDTELRWLNILTYGLLLSWGWTLLIHLLSRYLPLEIADLLGIAYNYATFVLINAFFAYSISYAHQLLATKPQRAGPAGDTKPAQSAISKVREAMEVEKLYLKRNLNLEQFSNRIGLPPKEVSAVINKHFGTNFFEFINSYRVEKAKMLLADQSKADMTVLDVLLESGFNSKSAFNRFFRRLAGESPNEYRRRALALQESVEPV